MVEGVAIDGWGGEVSILDSFSFLLMENIQIELYLSVGKGNWFSRVLLLSLVAVVKWSVHSIRTCFLWRAWEKFCVQGLNYFLNVHLINLSLDF